MSTPSRIAVIGSGVLVAATFTTNVLVRFAGQAFRPVSFAELAASAVPGALGIGLLVWIGIYFGARLAAPDRRNGRLMKLVVTTYGVLGVLLSLPIDTHAVRVDMPSAGDASAIQITPVLVSVVAVVGIVLGSLFITRVLAAFSRPRIA